MNSTTPKPKPIAKSSVAKKVNRLAATRDRDGDGKMERKRESGEFQENLLYDVVHDYIIAEAFASDTEGANKVILKLSDELMQEIYERTMTASEKRKDTMLKKKYDDSDMKKNMQAQYGKEEGKKVYFATIRKQAMKKEEVESVEEKIKYDKSGSSMDYFLGADPKKTEYYKKNAKKKIKKEEVEVVNEVSKKTLGSYVKKAATEIGTSAMKGDYKKMQKRHKGVLDASDKLAKEDYSANPAQQAAIAIAKKERKQDLKVAQKKKMKEEVVTELNRFEKEKGVDTKTGKPVTKGGTAKNDKAFQFVMKKVGKQRMGANQPKKVRGAKNPNETSPTKQKMTRMKAAKASSRAFETRAKRAGYKTAQDYANVVARYGSEDNMKKGRGLGT